jgi:hypothetical protein
MNFWQRIPLIFTIAFVLLKLDGAVAWSWFTVLSPLGLYSVMRLFREQ